MPCPSSGVDTDILLIIHCLIAHTRGAVPVANGGYFDVADWWHPMGVV